MTFILINLKLSVCEHDNEFSWFEKQEQVNLNFIILVTWHSFYFTWYWIVFTVNYFLVNTKIIWSKCEQTKRSLSGDTDLARTGLSDRESVPTPYPHTPGWPPPSRRQGGGTGVGTNRDDKPVSQCLLTGHHENPTNLCNKACYRSMGTTGDPVPSGHRSVPDHHFIG